MATRYPTYKVLDYCFDPVPVSKNGISLYVPCGKCAGCRLHSSNLWSQRLQMEIESSCFSIYFTLTYANRWLPVMACSPIPDGYSYFPLWNNKRLVPRIDQDGYVTSVFESRRLDAFYYEFSEHFLVPITNYPHDPLREYLPYPSQRDIVLWLKSVRKSLKNHFKNESTAFRYYIISELGGKKYRPHAHGLIFCNNEKHAKWLRDYALFACWQMCDKALFDEYTVFADAGTETYSVR